MLEVETDCLETTAARVVLAQRVMRAGVCLVDARVTIVALSGSGRPQRMPAGMRAALEG
jgi:acyl-CoA thioester hydrolase